MAKNIGPIPFNLDDNPEDTVKKTSEGRDADVVVGVFGHNNALQLCIDVCRPGGKISSISVSGS